MGRAGSVYPLEFTPEPLKRAFDNTGEKTMKEHVTKKISERTSSISDAVQISLNDLYLQGYVEGYTDALKLSGEEREQFDKTDSSELDDEGR